MNTTNTTLPKFRTVSETIVLGDLDNGTEDQPEFALLLNPRATPEMSLAYGLARLRRLSKMVGLLATHTNMCEEEYRGIMMEIEAMADESLMLFEVAARGVIPGLVRTRESAGVAGSAEHARRPAAPDFSGIADILTAATVDLNHLLAAAMIRGGAAESANAKFMERVRHTAKSVEADLHRGLELLRSEVPDEAAIEGILTARAVDLESLAGLATSKTSSDGVDLAFAQTVARTARKVSTELGEANELLQAGALAS